MCIRDSACALEMIHTYSLIHDDLPALDNDNLRRGKPTSHVVFGEAKAILTGDALLSYAFEIMLNAACDSNGIRACRHIARAAGIRGMVGGQWEDVSNEGKAISSHMLRYIPVSYTHLDVYKRQSVYRSLIFCASVLLFIIYCMRFFLFYCFRQYNRSAICSGKSGFSACSAQGGPSAFPRPARRRD